MEWVDVNNIKPKLGQKCYCFYVMERFDGKIIKETRLLLYLKSEGDNRKYGFYDKISYNKCGTSGPWPVTHWMAEPVYPITTDKVSAVHQ